MALNPLTLATNLFTNWLSINASDIATGATNFANQYDTYAKGAVDLSGDSLDTANKAGMIAILSTLTTDETYESAADKFEQAIVTYWTGATFKTTSLLPIMSSEISSVVISPPAESSISTPLASIFANITETDKSVIASEIANALHFGGATTIKNIDEAAAVNLGSGKVGIPATDHQFTTGSKIVIDGTTNYNGVFNVEADTTQNQIVILAEYTSEDFSGGTISSASVYQTIVVLISGMTVPPPSPVPIAILGPIS